MAAPAVDVDVPEVVHVLLPRAVRELDDDEIEAAWKQAAHVDQERPVALATLVDGRIVVEGAKSTSDMEHCAAMECVEVFFYFD